MAFPAKIKFNPKHKILTSVRRSGKNVDSSSKSNALRHCGKKLRRVDEGVVVKKIKKVDEFSTKICLIYLQQ